MICLDFSKAFDTVRHSKLIEKLQKLPLQIEIVNWITTYFSTHSHQTKFCNITSNKAFTNSGVIQGSALGPFTFIVTASDLKAKNAGNKIIKYADDTYLAIPPNNIHTTESELQNIREWASENNLGLNERKSKEIIFIRTGTKKLPKPLKNIERITEINILGVSLNNKLNMNLHIDLLIKKANSLNYAIRILRKNGLNKESGYAIFQSLIISRLTYAIQSWYGFLRKGEINRLETYIKRAKRFSHCAPEFDFKKTVRDMDNKLFAKAMQPNHVLHQHLPSRSTHRYELRRATIYELPTLNSYNEKNFLVRLLYNA